ncbi:MAG: carboxypeptidase regulatory-like domain-containing protein [Bryobacteraceae bacterium]|nr:carboxypeptidase regulatory-like domain-containing protein [Bryobacteraceae bacterium]
MRNAFSVLAVAACALFVPALAQSQVLSVTNYRLISTERVNGSLSIHTLTADLVNTGGARSVVTATVSSPVPNLQTIPGQQNLHFISVPASSQVSTLDTFRIMVDNSQVVNYNQLQWTFNAPFANAGPNQTVPFNSTVQLNGTASSNPAGTGPLSYNWTFLSRPPGSSARITNSSNVMASFVADLLGGTWVIQLTVTNDFGSDVAVISVTTGNSPPVANAGPNQTVVQGAQVTLNGSASSDVDGNPLTYSWTLPTRPAGSNAVLVNPTSVMPTFVADRPGTYVARLVVNDGQVNSTPSQVTITTQNTAPVANAGPAQSVAVGALVLLSGAASTDVDGNPLTYAWSLTTRPAGSNAALSSMTAVNPSFTVDVAGTYVAQLIVNDGQVNSIPATVTITTTGVLAPTANAGQNQTVRHSSLVQLGGSGNDPQGRPLTYLWSFTTRPAGSTAVLTNPTTPAPTFVADRLGNYVVQLIVSNGTDNSQPSTVTITTTNTAPVANAGQNLTAALNSVVTLNGTLSSDADGDALTYAWTFNSRPAGSTATLQAPTSASPTFVPDLLGTYVVQLIVNDPFAASVPATVTVTVTSNSITLTPDPLNLQGGPGQMTATLNVPAGPSGQVINLTSAAPGVATVPVTVTVPANQTSIVFNVTPVSGGPSTITATSPGFRPGTALVNVVIPAITLSLSAGTVGVSRTINGTVTINSPAPLGGATINVTAAQGGIVSVGGNPVQIATGATTGSFTLTGLAVGQTTLTASANGYTSGTLPVTASALGQIAVERNVTVAPGETKPIAISLATPAGQGGVTVTLASNSTANVQVVGSVSIAQGNTTPQTPATVTGVAFGTAQITASANGYTGDSATVSVGAALTFTPATMTIGAGGQQNLTLSLNGPAPSSTTINLVSSNPQVASVPSSVVLPQNATSILVPVSGSTAGSVTISATPASGNILGTTASVTVTSSGNVQMPPTATLSLGQSASVQVSLSVAAPAGGVTVNLSTSDVTRVSLSAATAFIAAGATTPAVQPTMTAVGPGLATITATANGYAQATQAVSAAATLSLSPSTPSVPAGGTQSLTVTLSGAAPAGGFTVNLTSATPAVATVTPSVVIQAGATTATVTVSALIPGTAVITASGSGATSGTATVTVLNSNIILLSDVNVTPGGAASLSVRLPAPAASNMTVALQIANTAIASLSSSSVTILAGQTQAAVSPLVFGNDFGTTTITGSANGFGPGTSTVRVGAALSFNQQNLTVSAGSAQSLQLSLSVIAPPGGVPVTLTSSNPGVLIMPSGTNISQNSGGVNFVVTGLAAGTTTITASTSAVNISPATITITVPGATGSGALSLPVNAALAVGQTIPFPVTLSTPAGAGGVVVTLSSGNVARATISPSTVTIPEGLKQAVSAPTLTAVSPGTVTISASAPNYTSDAQPVTIQGAATLTLAPATVSVVAGSTQTLTVTLPAAAPGGGLLVTLVSDNAAATVPASVLVQTGATTAQFQVTGVSAGSATVTASASGQGSATSAITVTAAGAINLPANFLVGPGQTRTFPVTLATPAAVTTTVTLTSLDLARMTISPATITFNAGQTTPVSPASVTGVSEGTVSVTAAGSGLTNASTSVRVGYTLAFSPATLSINGTSTQNLNLTLSSPAPANLTVNLSSGTPGVATVSPTVFFAAGSSTAAVPVTGVTPGNSVITASTATIPATTATVTVSAPNVITVPALTVVSLGKYVAFPVTLPAPAGVNGVTVTLTSADDTKVIVPGPVFIAPGQTQPAAQPQILAENVGDVNVTASAPGYLPGVGVVKIGTTATWQLRTMELVPGQSRVAFINLGASAPGQPPFPGDTGVRLDFVSSDPSVASIRPFITAYPDGSEFTIIAVVITANAPGTVTITSSGINIPADVMTVNVSGPLTINTTSLPNGTTGTPYSFTLAGGGGTAPRSWSIASGALPAGLTLNSATGVISGTPTQTVFATPITFRLSDSSFTSVTMPMSLTIVAGQVNGGTMLLTPSPLSITGTATQNMTVTLSNPAPAGGLTVNLSSGTPAAATVASTVTVNAGASIAQFPVTGVAPGTTIITATALSYGQATATVNVTAQGTINLPANFLVGPGQTVPFSVTLASAPVVPTTVSLVSADPSRVTISPASISFNAGQTTPIVTPTVTGVAEGVASITASGSNLTTASTSVRSGYSISFTPATLAISGTATQNLNLTLSSPASGALTVNLVSGTPGVATVGGTVTIANGATTATVPVTGVSSGTSVITASTATIPATTATVTVSSPNVISVPATTVIGLGKYFAFPVTLPSPAGVNGVTVTITSADATKVIVPGPVFIAPGQTQPAVQPQLLAENVGDVNVTASAPGYVSGVGVVKVGTTATWQLRTIEMVPGESRVAFINLGASAPGQPPFPGDTGVRLDFVSSNPAIAFTRPFITAYPDGSEFTIIALVVNALTPGTVTITSSGINIPAEVLTVIVGGPLSISTTSLPNGTVGVPYSQTLAGGGGTSPRTWSLASGVLPAGLSLNASTGVISGTPTLAVSATPLTFRLTDSASPNPQTITASMTLTIAPGSGNATMSLTPSPLTVAGTATQNLTLSLSVPAPVGGLVVSLSSATTAAATVPASINVSAGASTATVPVTGVAPGSSVVTATASGYTQATANITVTGAATPDIILPQGLVVAPGDFKNFPITLARASANATFVTLAVSDPNVATMSQTSIYFAPGQTTPNIQPRINGGVTGGTVTITATASGLTTATTTALVGVALSFTPAQVTINGLSTQSVTVSLSSPLASNAVVALSASTPGIVSFPATVTIPAGFSTATVAVNGTQGGNTVLTASTPGANNASLNVTVIPPTLITVQPVAVALGQTATLPITISPAAPAGGITLTLSSAQAGIATVPASVTIPAGQTAPTSPVLVTGVNVGSSTITVSAPASVPATAAATVSTTIAWQSVTPFVNTGSQLPLSLRMNASAPVVGSVLVSLTSSNPAIAQVPASVSFIPDASPFTTQTFNVVGVTEGTVTITAQGVNIAPVTLTVNVVGPLAVSTNSLAAGSVALAYSQALTRTGGRAPFTWALTNGTLPAGLTLDSVTGIISGTPTAAANAVPLTFQVSDSSIPAQVASATLALDITAQTPGSLNDPTGGGQSAAVTTAFGNRLGVLVKDTNGNPISGITVTFAVPASGASATFAAGVNTAVSDASGIATSNVISANSVAGAYTVTASVGSVASTVSFPLTNTAGAANSITATAGGAQTAIAGAAFALPLSATVRDSFGNPVSGVSVTFAATTVSGATATFTGTNPVLTNAAGLAVSPVPTANAALGTYVATATAQGVASPASFTLSNTNGPPASINYVSGGTPAARQLSLPTGVFATRLTVRVLDANGLPSPGVQVLFTPQASTPPGATVLFAGGVQTATTDASGFATSAAMSVNNAVGVYNVNATVTGAPGLTPAVFGLNNATLPPGLLTVDSGTPQTTTTNLNFGSRLVARVLDASGAVALSGIPVTFTAPTSGASGTFFGSGATHTVLTDVNGLATSATLTANGIVGSFTVSASVGSLTPAVFNLTNDAIIANGPVLSIPNVQVGKDLQVQITVTLPVPAAAGGELIIRSTDYNVARLSGRLADRGLAQPLGRIPIVAGQSQVTGIYVQGWSASGIAQIIASYPGYTDGVGTVIAFPSGFVVSGPNGAAGSFNMFQGASAQLTVNSARLTETNAFAEIQATRGDVAFIPDPNNPTGPPILGPNRTINVNLSNSTAAVGGVSPATVSFPGGESAATTSFTSIATGASTVTVAAPSGFSTPSSGADAVVVNVAPAGLVAPSATVGANLQVAARLTLNSPAPCVENNGIICGLPVTITSLDPNVAKLSVRGDSVAGATSIQILVPQGRTNSQDFWVQGQPGGGSVSYTVSAPGYSGATGTATVTASGFVLITPVGTGVDFSNSIAGGLTSNLTVLAARLDGTGRFAEAQAIRGDFGPVSVAITSSNQAVGTATPSPVSVTTSGTSSSGLALFTPLTAGTTLLTAVAPSGFSTPSAGSSATATVQLPGVGVPPVTVGRGLQTSMLFTLGQPAPVGGLAITITSNAPAAMLVSDSMTNAGTTSVTVNLPGGATSGSFFVQGLSNTGSSTLTISAGSGYRTATGTVTLVPSGVIMRSSDLTNGSGQIPADPNSVKTFQVATGILDPTQNNSFFNQPVSPGAGLTVLLSSSNGAAGTIPASVVIAQATDSQSASFTAGAISGQGTTISMTQPSGFTALGGTQTTVRYIVQ